MKSPIFWIGGKSRTAAKIAALIPPHRIYVEPFGGGASVLFAKEPSLVEVYNDLDGGLVNFFRVLQNKFDAFYKLAVLAPYSREEYAMCRSTWQDCSDDVERAYRWFIVARMSFGGRFNHSWGFTVQSTSRGMASACSKWLSAVDGLPAVHERLQRVLIENNDFKKVFATFDTPETFFYVDPPYILETRKGGGYRYELTDADHTQLVEILLNLKGQCLLSGYAHPLYEPLEQAGWTRHDDSVVCSVAGRTRNSNLQGAGSATATQQRVESLWIKPSILKGDAET